MYAVRQSNSSSGIASSKTSLGGTKTVREMSMFIRKRRVPAASRAFLKLEYLGVVERISAMVIFEGISTRSMMWRVPLIVIHAS